MMSSADLATRPSTSAVGSTGSASFASGTSVTPSVSNGRDAIWSGACSRGQPHDEVVRVYDKRGRMVIANAQ